MSEQTKSCNLTTEEVKELIYFHGRMMPDNTQNRMERISYLGKRLDTFKELELTEVKQSETAKGWGT